MRQLAKIELHITKECYIQIFMKYRIEYGPNHRIMLQYNLMNHIIIKLVIPETVEDLTLMVVVLIPLCNTITPTITTAPDT